MNRWVSFGVNEWVGDSKCELEFELVDVKYKSAITSRVRKSE